MIARDLAAVLADSAATMPCVWVTGPRQSGKTTLCRARLPHLPYVSLEPLDVRGFATEDPRGFLAQFPDGAVLDEIQRAPELLSYIQEAVDADPRPGRFVLNGSQQLGIAAAVTQSLAGRVAVLHLLPPSWGELARFDRPDVPLTKALVTGSYPRIFDRGVPPQRWLADYFTTYIQRDVRQVLRVADLETFTLFVRLCAGSSGQELNLARLGVDAGIAQPTARAWLSVLEATFVCWRLPAWHASPRKRLVRAAKLHFYDTGLLCHLLGIRDAEQLRLHPSRGAIFETWVASELRKQRLHRGLPADMWHLRQVAADEVDLLVRDRDVITLVESKAGETVHAEALAPLRRVAEALAAAQPELRWRRALVHGGGQRGTRGGTRQVPWRQIEELGPAGAS